MLFSAHDDTLFSPELTVSSLERNNTVVLAAVTVSAVSTEEDKVDDGFTTKTVVLNLISPHQSRG